MGYKALTVMWNLKFTALNIVCEVSAVKFLKWVFCYCRVSVCVCVCYTPIFCQSGSIWNHRIFVVNSL